MSGQQLRVHVSVGKNLDWLLWVAVVIDGTLDPPVIHGRLRADATEEDVRAKVLYIVERRYSVAEAKHARWVGADQVPTMAHAAMSDVLFKSLRLTPERTNRDRRPPARKRTMMPGSSRMRTLIRLHGPECCWCGKTCLLDVSERHPDRATVEHVVPKSKGGSNRLPNLRVACYACNNRRGDENARSMRRVGSEVL